MGEFTQNLLKLTEFPFSYSLIGLISIIAGQGPNLEDLSFAKIGPLLILMGFFATTLSICDPIGALQRLLLKGRELQWWEFKNASDLINATIFGNLIMFLFPFYYILAIPYSPEEIKKRFSLDWKLIQQAPYSGKTALIVEGAQ